MLKDNMHLKICGVKESESGLIFIHEATITLEPLARAIFVATLGDDCYGGNPDWITLLGVALETGRPWITMDEFAYVSQFLPMFFSDSYWVHLGVEQVVVFNVRGDPDAGQYVGRDLKRMEVLADEGVTAKTAIKTSGDDVAVLDDSQGDAAQAWATADFYLSRFRPKK